MIPLKLCFLGGTFSEISEEPWRNGHLCILQPKKRSTALPVGVMMAMPLALRCYTGEVSVCACLFLCWSRWVCETGTGTIPLCARGPCWRSAWSVTLSGAAVTVTTGTLPIYTSSTLKVCKVPSTLEARWRAPLPFRPNNHVTTLRQMQMQQQCGLMLMCTVSSGVFMASKITLVRHKGWALQKLQGFFCLGRLW